MGYLRRFSRITVHSLQVKNSRSLQRLGVSSTPPPTRYPQSNGMAERAVQTAKNLLEKAKHDSKHPYLALLAYKSTSIDDIGSPAELLMGLRTQLPTTSTMLQPKMMNNIIPKLKARQLKEKTYYDRAAHTLPPLTNGDTVRVRTKHQKWRPAVLQQQVAPRSYLVKTGEHTLRRN